MVNINDTVNIHDGVTLVFCRHDDAMGQNITATGAAWAYALGKLMGDCFKIDSPEYIIHSPIARARNTAKMHQIGMKVNDISNPQMKYDARLHESASTEVAKEAVIEAINEAKWYGVRTIEAVTHSNGPVALAEAFGGHPRDTNLGYGGIVVVKANSWEDMIAGKITDCQSFHSSIEAVESVIGKEQTSILDYLFALGKTDSTPAIDLFFKDCPEIQNLWAGDSCMSDEEKLKRIFKYSEEKTAQWLIDAVSGKEVDTIVPPSEYMDIFDAYKFWAQNLALSVGITPELKDPLYSELAKKLLGDSALTFSEKFLINEEKYDGRDPKADAMGYAYPILNARMKAEEEKRGIAMSAREAGNQVVADMLEDFPGYRDSMVVGQGRYVSQDEEVVAKDGIKASYHIKDGDDGEHHVMLNKMIWEKLKARGQGQG